MHLLVGDDEPLVLSSIMRMFARYGHQARGCATGQETLRLAGNGDFDLLVLDLGLPDIDGTKVIRRLREDGRTTPILVLTGRKSPDDAARALDAGADDYVRKSDVNPRELLARAEALVRRSHTPAAEPILTRPGLRVDVRSRTAFLQGRAVELTPSEVRVFAELAREIGAVVAKEALQAALTGDTSPNALECTIARLRRKLTPHAALRCVRLCGYVLTIQEVAPGLGNKTPGTPR